MGACYANGFSGIFISINRLWNLSNSGSTDSVSHSIFIFFSNALSSMTATFQEPGNSEALWSIRKIWKHLCPVWLPQLEDVPWDAPSPPTEFNGDEDTFTHSAWYIEQQVSQMGWKLFFPCYQIRGMFA